ncbi:MAG TPA: hypothetical protein VIF11_08875 [Methylomirabilota bacterium]
MLDFERPCAKPGSGAADPPPREKSDELRPEEAAEPVVAPAASAGSAVRKSATITLLPARLRPPDDLNAVAIAGAMQAADPPYPGGREPQEPAAVAEIFIFENAAGLLACSGRVRDLEHVTERPIFPPFFW